MSFLESCICGGVGAEERAEGGPKRGWLACPRRGVKFCFCSTTGGLGLSGVEGKAWCPAMGAALTFERLDLSSAIFALGDLEGLASSGTLVVADADAVDENNRFRRTGLGWKSFCGTAGNIEFVAKVCAGLEPAL